MTPNTHMRLLLSISLTVSLAIGNACTAESSQPSPVAKSTPAANSNAVVTITPQTIDTNRITVADAKKEFDAGTAVFVDVRAEAAYKMERIKGALNIPIETLDSQVSKLPKGKKLIIYCS